MSLSGTTSFGDMHQQSNRIKMVGGYALQQKLGAGSFATVYKGVKVPHHQQQSQQQSQSQQPQSPTQQQQQEDDNRPDAVAIKAITRMSEKLTKKVLQNLEIEISILRTYRHPNIVCMHNVQKTERHFYLILEFCGGGDVQGLIRNRKSGRLSEGLTRRLTRDLASGLRFLWGQELIHRDIKPQNLLLTGPLPLDELNDPERTPEAEQLRQRANYPSAQFSLKIADFGFARHLQTTSLAETLCGSPLYMAPEILQHHRYDAKADLWSVGTVLFEMIAGRPPFNGENHIDLLRNIQRKSVRLPPDVRVSTACVNLLRVLLNRNPLSRAGFKEFFEACDAFVALGCQGVATQDAGTCRKPTTDLGTIHEDDSPAASATNPPGSNSLLTVATHAPPAAHQQQIQQQVPFTRTSITPIQSFHQATAANAHNANQRNRLTPLQPSPPGSTPLPYSNARIPLIPSLPAQSAGQQAPQQTSWQTAAAPKLPANIMPRVDFSQSIGAASTDDSGFVMVDRDIAPRTTDPFSQLDTSGIAMTSHAERQMVPNRRGIDTNQRYIINTPPVVSNRADYANRRPGGILGTSPGTGGLLMGLVGRMPQRLGYPLSAANPTTSSPPRLEVQVAAANKLLATAEDVGRRAVSVAHLGDTRAYLAMRLLIASGESSSMLSSTPMEGVEEEPGDKDTLSGCSSPTEVMTSTRRRSSSLSEKAILEAKKIEDDAEEMPFAVSPEAIPVALPSRESNSVYGSTSRSSNRNAPPAKATPQTIRAHFGEALSCYLKALKMLKSAVGGAQKVAKEYEILATQLAGRNQSLIDLPKMQKRCEVTSQWLSGQFKGVLERADASQVEIAKLQIQAGKSTLPVLSVEELIYNHSLACGREGAVKQLLGQHDAARSCYRSAGLLIETLMMEQNISKDDRKILEEYVDGFATRINELDQLMLQQSRMAGSSSANSSRRGSGVVGLIAPPPAAPSFLVGNC